MQMIKNKHSVALLISFILSIRYLIKVIIPLICSEITTDGGLKAIMLIVVCIFALHMILFTLATIFNLVALIANKRGFAMTSIICYILSVFFCPATSFIIYLLPNIIFSILGYINLKKIIEINNIKMR